MNRRILLAALCSASGLCAASATAQDFAFFQVTDFGFGTGVFEPTISGDGSRIAFRTTGNLTGGNPDGSLELFVFDRRDGSIRQVTSTPGGSGTSILYPMITPDGAKVAFRSLWNFFTGTPGDTFDLWEVDVETGVYRQITDNPPNTPTFDPRMSGDGNFIVFLSRINPTGQNADGSLEVFRVDRRDNSIIQISSNATTVTEFPDINGDGSVIVWGDRANYDGTNSNGGLEIWKWNNGVITAVTNQAASVVESNLPKVDDSGRYVSFNSLFDFSGGTATGRKVFVADTQTGVITLITSTGVGNSGFNVPDSEMAPDGSAVYFESNINLGGQNPDQNRELWRYDIAAGTLKALTATTGGVTIVQLSDEATRRYVEISRDSNTLVYRSDQNLDPAVDNTGDSNLDLFFGSLPLCGADVNSNGELDFGDFLKFFNCFDAEQDCADIDGVAGVDFGDFLNFFNQFDAGC